MYIYYSIAKRRMKAVVNIFFICYVSKLQYFIFRHSTKLKFISTLYIARLTSNYTIHNITKDILSNSTIIYFNR